MKRKAGSVRTHDYGLFINRMRPFSGDRVAPPSIRLPNIRAIFGLGATPRPPSRRTEMRSGLPVGTAFAKGWETNGKSRISIKMRGFLQMWRGIP